LQIKFVAMVQLAAWSVLTATILINTLVKGISSPVHW
jgi:hypothetical protein